MPRQKTRKAAAIAARIDRRPLIALTAISVLTTLVLALCLLQ